MQLRTNSIVHQVIRPVWNAWMRFGSHYLSIATVHADGSKVGHPLDCSNSNSLEAGGQPYPPLPGEH